jgi:hypothetical protein
MSETNNFTGLRVLVVEDEALVAMLVEDMLADLGCTVIGPVADLAEALKVVADTQIDCALLDVNLAGKPAVTARLACATTIAAPRCCKSPSARPIWRVRSANWPSRGPKAEQVRAGGRSGGLAGSVSLHRQGVHGAGKLLAQGRVDHALPRHTSLTLESERFDHHIEMAFAALAGAGVSRVAVAVVDHIQPRGGEGMGQLVAQRVGDQSHWHVNP